MIRYIEPGARMSQAVAAGNLVFLAGQVAADPLPDVGVQTMQILSQIDALLAQAGSRKDHILSASIWLSDISRFQEMNAVWDNWVVPGRTPARATVEAKLALPKYLVEIAVIAAIPGD
jgi:enamine deaminase RidA (YjgF/YER057c/UK114 family)